MNLSRIIVKAISATTAAIALEMPPPTEGPQMPILWMGTRLQVGMACDWRHAQRAQHFLRTEGRPGDPT